MADTGRDAALRCLPLTPAVFDILLSLADEDRHGYGIAKEIEGRTGGRVKLGPGTLYGTLSRMLDSGLVQECVGPACQEPAAERRRYYRITPFGRQVARAEAHRLSELVRAAQAKALLKPGRLG